jgi:hypothetical protein
MMALSNPPSATQLVTQLALRLTSGDKDPIRGMKTPDGRSLFSVYDAILNTGAYASKGAVLKAFSRMIAEGSDTKEEVLTLCLYHKFPGRGQRDTPCMDIRGLQRLISLLGGKIGAEYRRLAETTLTRLVAGDETMIGEIEENAVSDAPMQTLAREALGAEHMVGEGPGPTDDAMEVDEEERMVIVRAIASDVRQFAPLVPMMKVLTDEVALLRADRDNQARLRHQADGRYGSEIREANKNVREQAEYWKKQAEKFEGKNDEKDRMLLDMMVKHEGKNDEKDRMLLDMMVKHERKIESKDQMILECHSMLAEVARGRSRERSRSPHVV